MTLTKEDLEAIEGLFTGKFDGIDRQLQLSSKLNVVSAKLEATYELALEKWGQIEESKGCLTILES